MDRAIVDWRDAQLMAINRRFLYAGLFLVALGGVLVAAQLTAVSPAALQSALRLWPLAWIAIGLGIVLRRSRFALVAGILAASVPGAVLGGALAVAPQYSSECGSGTDAIERVTDQGILGLGGDVAITVDCGALTLDSRPGTAWTVTSNTSRGRKPDISGGPELLSIRSSGGESWLDAGKQDLAVTLPSGRIRDLSLRLSAGRSTLSLAGTNIDNVDLVGNAADVLIDGRGANVLGINGTLDFGRLSVQMPQGPYLGTFSINAGQLRLCTPFGMGLHVEFSGGPREVRVNGAVIDGSVWENDAYAGSSNHVNLTVRVNFGSVLINPIGGCK